MDGQQRTRISIKRGEMETLLFRIEEALEANCVRTNSNAKNEDTWIPLMTELGASIQCEGTAAKEPHSSCFQ